MLFTDFTRLASDNSENDWQELYSYAEKIGKNGRGYEFMMNEIPYFHVGKIKYRQFLTKDKIVRVSRNAMLLYLKHGTIPPMTLLIDYSQLNQKKRFTECCRDIEAHNGIEYPNCIENYKKNFGKISLKWVKDDLEVYIEFSHTNKEGIAYKKIDGVEFPLEIPKYITERLYKNAQPLTKKYADSFKFRLKR